MVVKRLTGILNGNPRIHAITLCNDGKLRLDLCFQLFQILFNRFFSDEGIAIGIGFQLCSIHEHVPEPHLTKRV